MDENEEPTEKELELTPEQTSPPAEEPIEGDKENGGGV